MAIPIEGRRDGGLAVQPCCIVTYRGAPGSEGRANLDAVLAWLARSPDHETIVVEQDTHPRIAPPLPHPGARVVFAWNGGPFNRAWGLNVGARLTTASVLAFGETDVVVPGGLGAALSTCARVTSLVKPYRQLRDLSADETAALRERGASALAPACAGREGRDVLCGGWFALRRAAFDALGGFDERFADGGGEDEAMTIAVERARLSACELDGGPALRLASSRPHATAAEGARFAASRALLGDYARYDDGALARVAALGRQTRGRRDKYRPADGRPPSPAERGRAAAPAASPGEGVR